MDFFVKTFGWVDPIAILNTFNIIAFSVCGYLVFVVITRNQKIKSLTTSFNKLMRSFNNLDEQAKLIVRTDLELNRAQEELDKRLAGLNALQKTSRIISTSFDKKEIFRRLKQSLPMDLGFEKILIFMTDDNKELRCQMQVGFYEDIPDQILSNMKNHQSFFSDLKEGHPLSSLTSPKQKKEWIEKLFGIPHFVLNPILTQDGFIGLLFVGNTSSDAAITEGDEEIISILAGQIGQSMEMAQLFEQVYRSRQVLELKVQDRTRQLESALEKVKKISKNKSDFVSAVSHELRTPLTSVKGYASILITGKLGEIPPKVKERLEKINKHSDNLVKLINELLDISRIESGRVEMKFAPQRIRPLIENIHDLLTPQMKEKNIQFKIEMPENIPEVYIDISQIERVFINLLSNAIKYTPRDGTISIRVRLFEEGFIKCEVSDTGIGIKEDDLPRLFEEFYRVDNEFNQNVKGTGLGLSLVKHIIEAHKGKIWVSSEMNIGTTFHFTLPTVK